MAPVYYFKSAQYNGDLITEVYPSIATPIVNKQFSITGRLKKMEDTTITLNFGTSAFVTDSVQYK